MEPSGVRRRLAAILCADIAGYSRLMGVNDQETVAALKAHLAEVLPLIARCHGRVVDLAGDGILAEFASAVAAVECARDIQQLMRARNADVPDARRMTFRIGINLGEVIHDDERIYGEGINVAARLENMAEPGGIRVSAKVMDEVDGKVACDVVDLGIVHLKNIERPVHVFELAFATAGPDGTRSSAPVDVPHLTAPRLSIVVLPFVNANGDASHDYFADGITEDITTQLSGIRGSYVIGRNTAFRYKGKAVDPRAVGAELGVRYLLRGRVERIAEGVDTMAQLIDCASGEALWDSTIEVDVASVRNIRREVVSRMTIALNLPLIKAEARRSMAERADHPDVVDLVMQARAAYYGRASADAMRASRALYRKALAIEPDDQPALVGLATTLVTEAFGWAGPDADSLLREADTAMTRAMRSGRGDAYAHYVMSRLLQMQGRIEAAIAENDIALELNPNLVEAIAWRGAVLSFSGDPASAIEPLERACAQSPKDTMRWMWYFWLGLAHLMSTRPAEAIAWLERSIAINPQYWGSLASLTVAYATIGEMEKALHAKARFDEIHDDRAVDLELYSTSPAFIALVGRTIMPAWLRTIEVQRMTQTSASVPQVTMPASTPPPEPNAGGERIA